LGNEVFNRRAGLAAAIIIAVWPTYLLHSTQVLKDQFFIPAFLGLVFVTVQLLNRSLSGPAGLVSGLIGGALVIFLWLVKADLWELSLVIVVTGVILLIARTVREKSILPGNLIAVFLLIACLLGTPQLFSRYRKPNPHPLLTVSGTGANQQITIHRAPGDQYPPIAPPSRSSTGMTRLRERIAWARYLYANYPDSGSTIDPHVRLESWGEIIRYVPRALEVALFAPFPNTWLAEGTKVGRGGRILSGVETLLLYFVYILAAVSVWKRRRFLAVWLVLSVAMASLIALSIVTANLGALYRLRYPFWMLLIIMGANGAFELREILSRRRSSVTATAGTCEPV